MSAPPGDGNGGTYGASHHEQSPEQPYQDQQFEGAAQQDAGSAAGKKKKRGYAAGAFDVGSGANAGVGGQMPTGGQYGMPPATGAPGYGGYQGGEQAQQPIAQGYPQNYGAPGQPVPQQAGYGGYSAPDQGYPVPGTQPGPVSPGVGGITGGMGNMNISAQPHQQQQPGGQMPRTAALNQLYPSDLLNQPFNVSELDLPPPPILLPPNV